MAQKQSPREQTFSLSFKISSSEFKEVLRICAETGSTRSQVGRGLLRIGIRSKTGVLELIKGSRLEGKGKK